MATPQPINPASVDYLIKQGYVTSPDPGAVQRSRSRYSPYKEMGKYDVGLNPSLFESTTMDPATAQSYLRGANQTNLERYANGFVSRAASIPVKVLGGLGSVMSIPQAIATGELSPL